MKTLSALVILIAGMACGAPSVMAQTAPANADKPAKKAPAKKAATAKESGTHEDSGKSTDVSGLTPTAFNCELGNKLTIYQHADDDQQIQLQWNKHLHHLTRVSTSTGAHRFENTKEGLVWIGIPAKGMLLDSKKGQQLANECKSADQAAQKVVEQKSLGIAK
jgi:hypothetical protein